MVIYSFIVDDASITKEYVLNNPHTGVATFTLNKVEINELNSTSDANISKVTVGKGNGAVATNTVFGRNALNHNTTGIQNTAMGYDALYSNITGESNVAIGVSPLYYNTTGNVNLAIGVNALYKNRTGNYNTAVGTDALMSNTTGSYNTAINYDSLHLIQLVLVTHLLAIYPYIVMLVAVKTLLLVLVLVVKLLILQMFLVCKTHGLDFNQDQIQLCN